MKQYKHLTPAHVATLVEAGEAAHDLACIDKRGGIAAIQNNLTAAEGVQDVLDSINQNRFALVLNALTEQGISKLAKAARGDTGSRSAGGLELRYEFQHVGTGNILSTTYSTANGFSIRDTLTVDAAYFAATLGHMLETADALDAQDAAIEAAEAATKKAQSLVRFATLCGITHTA